MKTTLLALGAFALLAIANCSPYPEEFDNDFDNEMARADIPSPHGRANMPLPHGRADMQEPHGRSMDETDREDDLDFENGADDRYYTSSRRRRARRRW